MKMCEGGLNKWAALAQRILMHWMSHVNVHSGTQHNRMDRCKKVLFVFIDLSYSVSRLCFLAFFQLSTRGLYAQANTSRGKSYSLAWSDFSVSKTWIQTKGQYKRWYKAWKNIQALKYKESNSFVNLYLFFLGVPTGGIKERHTLNTCLHPNLKRILYNKAVAKSVGL